MNSKGLLLLDGSYGEGGGQILRTALLFSLLTGIPFKMVNIRKGRPKPGLKPQHLHILKALLRFTESVVSGAEPGSTEILFHPGTIKGGKVILDFRTAGSITLFLQTVLPVSFFALSPLHLEVRGGTDVPMSMTWDYFKEVLLPTVSPFGGKVEATLMRRGFYPRGGGEVRLKVTPCYKRRNHESLHGFLKRLRALQGGLDLESGGNLKRVLFYSTASRHLKERKVAERQVEGARRAIEQILDTEVEAFINYEDALSPGSSFLAVAVMERSRLGADSLGKLGKRAEDVGREAVQSLMRDLEKGVPVDSHLADNLIPWLALFGGKIRVPYWTSHLKTNIWVTEQFLGSIFDEERNLIAVSRLPGRSNA